MSIFSDMVCDCKNSSKKTTDLWVHARYLEHTLLTYLTRRVSAGLPALKEDVDELGSYVRSNLGAFPDGVKTNIENSLVQYERAIMYSNLTSAIQSFANICTVVTVSSSASADILMNSIKNDSKMRKVLGVDLVKTKSAWKLKVLRFMVRLFQ